MEHPNCDCAAATTSSPAHCEDHSGQLVYMRSIATLLVISAGLLSYSVFWQAPSIKTEIAKEIARVDGNIKLVEKDVERLDSDFTELKGRVEKLEGVSHAP
jgi:hypothetical protein